MEKEKFVPILLPNLRSEVSFLQSWINRLAKFQQLLKTSQGPETRFLVLLSPTICWFRRNTLSPSDCNLKKRRLPEKSSNLMNSRSMYVPHEHQKDTYSNCNESCNINTEILQCQGNFQRFMVFGSELSCSWQMVLHSAQFPFFAGMPIVHPCKHTETATMQ